MNGKASEAIWIFDRSGLSLTCVGDSSCCYYIGVSSSFFEVRFLSVKTRLSKEGADFADWGSSSIAVFNNVPLLL